MRKKKELKSDVHELNLTYNLKIPCCRNSLEVQGLEESLFPLPTVWVQRWDPTIKKKKNEMKLCCNTNMELYPRHNIVIGTKMQPKFISLCKMSEGTV